MVVAATGLEDAPGDADTDADDANTWSVYMK